MVNVRRVAGCLLLLWLQACSDGTTPAPDATTDPTNPQNESMSNMMAPPSAARKSHSFTYHDITVEDPYAWLQDPDYPTVDDEEILDYLNAENAYFEQYMAPHQPLIDTLFEELKQRQPEQDASVPYLKNGYWYQWRYNAGDQYRTWYRAPQAQPEQWQVLLDENLLAGDAEYFRLGSIAVSPDGTKLAFSSDTSGGERFQLQLRTIADGTALIEPIENTFGSPVWSADSSSLLYVVLSEEWRPYRVYHRQLGADAADDQLIYEEQSESFFMNISLTESEQYVIIHSADHITSEERFIPRDNLTAAPTLIAPRQSGHEYEATHQGDHFIIRSNRRQPNYDLFRTRIDTPGQSHWELAYEGGRERYITGLLISDKRWFVAERIDGLEQINVVEADGRQHHIEFPEASYTVSFGTNPDYAIDQLRLSYSSMVTPQTVYRYDLKQRTLDTLKVQQIPSGYAADEFVTERLMAPTRDGVQVPVSIVRHKSTPLDASAPLYLYAYGAYGSVVAPRFSSNRISLLERGMIFAIAHIRGGDDLGYHWYTDGKLDKRTNTFNDFVDVARFLIDRKYSSAGKIAIAGGSAGGELMGAVVNQAPELWGAVAAHVPFVDVLNTMLNKDLPLTPIEWPEWGNPIESEADFRFIQSYSPYDQLTAMDYPPMLVTAGLNDPRVTYWEPAKYVAKIRHLKTDDQPLLLKTNMGAGHGGQSGRFTALRETAEEYAFFLSLLVD